MERGEEKMSTLKKKQNLEDVLNEYLATELVPSHKALKKWILLYPEYEKELTDFTVSWGLVEDLPKDQCEGESEDILVLRAMSLVEDRLYSLRNRKKCSETTITNLLEEAQKAGMGINELSNSVKVSIPIMTKLVRRIIDFHTIPNEVVQSIAAAIGQSFQTISEYLKLPVLADGIQFSSKTTPTLLQQESFFDAVRNDRSIDPKLREYWLSFERDLNVP